MIFSFLVCVFGTFSSVCGRASGRDGVLPLALLASIVNNASHFRRLSPISCHVALVFCKCPGEDVATQIITYEIEQLSRRGIQGGADRGLARI